MTLLTFAEALEAVRKDQPSLSDVHVPNAGGGKKPKEQPKDKFSLTSQIVKLNEDQQLAFGFFSVIEKNGQTVVDSEDDTIALADLEKGAYGHVLDARLASERHDRVGVGNLVESVVFTPEKVGAMVAALKSMGVEAVIDLPAVAWWGGYHVHDPKVWKAVKNREYVSFSIGGSARRSPANG